MRKREEATEMGGTFICNGIERIIRMLILPRRHYIMAECKSAYKNRGPGYSDMATSIRSGHKHPVLKSLSVKP